MWLKTFPAPPIVDSILKQTTQSLVSESSTNPTVIVHLKLCSELMWPQRIPCMNAQMEVQTHTVCQMLSADVFFFVCFSVEQVEKISLYLQHSSAPRLD